MKENRPMALAVTIVDRGHGGDVTKFYTAHQVMTHLRCEGTGTATSEILDILGLGASEKDLIVSLAPEDTLAPLFDVLAGDAPPLGRGIAFTVPLEALSSLMAAMVEFKTKEEKGEITMPTKKHSLILLTVNRGFADEVMATARQAGARGGTVLRGRWVGQEQFEEVYPSAHQEEKELIAVVAPQEQAEAIMAQVNEKHGLPTEAGAVVCSVGIDRLVHLH